MISIRGRYTWYMLRETDMCAICRDDLEENIKTLDCNHKFHADCIVRWIATSPRCPFCRARVHVPGNERYTRSGHVYVIVMFAPPIVVSTLLILAFIVINALTALEGIRIIILIKQYLLTLV